MSNKKDLHKFDYKGKRISFDFGDGEEMVNASEIVKAFGKRLRNFTRLQQTKDFILALEKEMNSKGSDLSVWKKAIKSVRGGNDPSLRGTWYEKRLALKLAAWLNPEFEIWIFSRIEELLSNGKVSLNSEIDMETKIKTLEWVFQKIKDNALEIQYLSEILNDLKSKKTSQ